MAHALHSLLSERQSRYIQLSNIIDSFLLKYRVEDEVFDSIKNLKPETPSMGAEAPPDHDLNQFKDVLKQWVSAYSEIKQLNTMLYAIDESSS